MSKSRTGWARIGAALVLLVAAAPVHAQQQSASGGSDVLPANAPRPVLVPGARTGELRIDGRIDEPDWQGARVFTGFVQAEPDEGQPALNETFIRMLIDDKAIYVSAVMPDPEPEAIGTLLRRRDEHGPFFDWFSFLIDPNNDKRTGYCFRTTAAGVQADCRISDDQFEDFTWNGVWESAVSIDSTGWTAEMRIPLSQIRYSSGEGPQTWGVNFTRRRLASSEMDHLAFMSRRKEEGISSKFARLENVVVPSSVRRIEAMPYALGSLHNAPAEDGDPFFDGSAGGARFGSDFRLGLGSSFTLDATVNPDFGQVEADPAEINLTAFETFFPEQRPFFVDDAQVFDFGLSGGQNKLFYSRRIGRAPRGSAPDDATTVDVPSAATILGAGKLTGRTSGGLSMGGLLALTQAETGRAFSVANGGTSEFAAEPRTEYGVVSVQQDLSGGASQIGVIATALHRGLPSDGAFDFLPDQAFNAGLRLEHQWGDRGWRLNGFLAGSHVRGSPAAITAIQRASNHYFQRPDGTRASVDSSATSMSGAEWRLQVDRQNTLHWTGSVWLAEVTKGFEINDLGFSNSRERIDGGFSLGYREIRPGKVFRNYNINFMTFYNFSHEALDDAFDWTSWRRAYTGGTFNLQNRVTFLNFHTANVNFSWQPDQYSRSATRGGPVMIQPGGMGVNAGFMSDNRRRVVLNAGANYWRASHGSGSNVTLSTGIQARLSSQLIVDLDPRLVIQSDGSQYVTSTTAASYTPTFGRRYLFGEIERTTLQVTTRVDYTFSPSLSFQVYAQPLISSGDYVRYKQLATPGTYAFRSFVEGQAALVGGTTRCSGGDICRDAGGTQHVDLNGDAVPDFTFRDRDFNVRSLIGNAVLRWEYRPGSTVFVVWQRQQQGDGTAGDFDFGRDLDAMFGAPATNRFIVKVNYWLGL